MVRDWTKDYFHEKYECYCDMVYRICMLYLKNESDARDGLQDIFLKMWEKQPAVSYTHLTLPTTPYV